MKTKTIYVATDGKEFVDESDCRCWEEAQRLLPLATSFETLTGCGREGFLEFAAAILKNNNITPI